MRLKPVLKQTKTDTRAETMNRIMESKRKNNYHSNKTKGKNKLLKFQSENGIKFRIPANRRNRRKLKIVKFLSRNGTNSTLPVDREEKRTKRRF